MKDICNKDNCTGCFACVNTCKVNCISMKEDETGCIYPQIDESKCVKCNQCYNVCPANKELEFNNPKITYASWSKNEEERKSSSSGGVASVFYRKILEHGGVAYGVSFDKEYTLRFVGIEDLKDIDSFKGSKYVHAHAYDSFLSIKKYLDQKREVLFIGTPCQVSGLKSYLRKEYENLLTVDLICHGVPPQKLLKEHIKHIENKNKEKSTNLSFRGKNSFKFTLYKQDKIVYKNESNLDRYFLGFLGNLFFRECCYNCKYAQTNRISDITIGDFWGLGKDIPFNYETKDGVSVILLNTDKGKSFINKISDELFLEQRDIKEAKLGNAQLVRPSKKNENYELFKKLYVKYGFEKASEKCMKQKLSNNRKAVAIESLKDVVKKIIRYKK